MAKRKIRIALFTAKDVEWIEKGREDLGDREAVESYLNGLDSPMAKFAFERVRRGRLLWQWIYCILRDGKDFWIDE